MKKKKKMDSQNPRTNGKSEAIQTKSHEEASHTHSQKGKKMHMYIKKLKKEECNQINKSTNDNKL